MLLFIVMSNKKFLDRDQFAVLAVLSANTFRKYEREGRVKPAGYVAGNRPGYNPDAADKLVKQATVYHLKLSPNEL